MTFAFDIGYASIGWCAIKEAETLNQWPEVIGTGVVIFPGDDCLASERRERRQIRRNIRARRARIDRVGRIMEHHGLLTHEQRMQLGHPAPFLLAARALQGKTELTSEELWQVLRWYAQNRGYDGNEKWRREKKNEEQEQDAQREAAAKQQMKGLGTGSMAETICALLGLSTDKEMATFTDRSPRYKAVQMAFPRETVEREVQQICENTRALPKGVRDLILGDVHKHRDTLSECGIRLPKRYCGSVLFGRLIPRFDNRLIERCPITWVRVYREIMSAPFQGSEKEKDTYAKKQAEKYAKVPTADCREFYEFRFARILANVRVDGRPLSPEERSALWKRAEIEGKFTPSAFDEAVRKVTGAKRTNLSNYFLIVPRADRALIFRPNNDDDKAKGRAPFARPVLRQVVEEVLQGTDPTRPALGIEHPDGEEKSKDGVLYCLQDPESDVSHYLATRSIDRQTNNPLVRHRMLIFGRLLKEMIKKYAGGDDARINRCVIEVAREVRTFAGKNNQDIKKELGLKLKGFNDAVKYLAENLPQIKTSANIIRKCRIAMDMEWRCPYTGTTYSAADLEHLELEHIIPYSSRNSNALHALVLTWPKVNEMKGKRTGLQFINEDGGKPVPGMQNKCILRVEDYKKLVSALKPTRFLRKGIEESDDDITRRTRKRFLLVEKLPSKSERSFTPGQLTQSSQLMRMAAQVSKRLIKDVKIAMVPGRITAEMRKYWKLMGLLIPVVPDVRDETSNDPDEHSSKTKDKAQIRAITHLHHAVDACALGLTTLLIPGGTNGAVWNALIQRTIPEEQIGALKSACRLLRFDSNRKITVDDLPQEVKNSVITALREERVVQHIPADMSGARLSENYVGFRAVKDGLVYIYDKKTRKLEAKKASGYVGADPKLSPTLYNRKTVLRVNENYGLALIGQKRAVVIRHISVYKTLHMLREMNPGENICILRRGQLIKIQGYKNVTRNGTWRVVSIKDGKDGYKLDLCRPSMVVPNKKHDWYWREVSVTTLLSLEDGFQILTTSYTGN